MSQSWGLLKQTMTPVRPAGARSPILKVCGEALTRLQFILIIVSFEMQAQH